MSFFDPEEITPKKIQVTPRVCLGGELLAIWVVGYGKTSATHLWDTTVSRAFSNPQEIEAVITQEMDRNDCDRMTAARQLILRAGVYELKERVQAKQAIEISPELATTLQSAADREGISVEEYLQRLVQRSPITYKPGEEG